MSKIFNNLNPSEQIALSNNDGWEQTTDYDVPKINKIKDTLQGGGIGYFKLGTSIPTPFARIMMFNHAFNSLTDMDDVETIYGKLVSECLDFIEFIYHFGDELEIKKWSFTDDINLLKGITTVGQAIGGMDGGNSIDVIFGGGAMPQTAAQTGGPVTGHALLADSLLNKRNELKNIDNIYLIYYNGVLIGGTSPYTLLFTSPNWQRRKNCGVVKGDAGNELFPNYQEDKTKGTPLHKRDIKFIQYLMIWRWAYGTGVSDCSLVKYIDNDVPFIGKMYPGISGANDKLKAKGSAELQQIFAQSYFTIEYNKAPVFAKDITGSQQLPLACAKPVPMTGSDYTIKADYASFNIVESNGATHTIQNALVLSDAGLMAVGGVSAKYVGVHPWDRNSYTIPSNTMSVPLYERELPGPGKHKQPFVIIDDFFEDILVRVPYSLNSERFHTFVDRDWNYLLPVKRLFFNFFKKERLLDSNFFSVTESDGEVVFKMNVPVTFNPGGSGVQQYLRLEKVYDKAHIKDLQGSSQFAMALFPAYRVMNDDTANRYTLMVGTANVPVALRFYNAATPQDAFHNEVESEDRPDDIKARFYRVSRAFDFIELEPAFPDMARTLHALIIPKLKEAYLDDTDSSWQFSIDFGTTNTYIAAMNAGEPVTFEITENDMQVAFLDKINYQSAFGSEDYVRSIQNSRVPAFHGAAQREFAPMLLSEKGIAKYPFQTVTCESSVFKINDGHTKNLFSQLSIGYNLNNEEFSQNYVYRTDIKWAASNGTSEDILSAQERIRLYCEQIAWMLRNKVAMNSSENHHEGKRFKVFYTYPCSMSLTDRANLKNAWQQAFGSSVTLQDMTESEAPYYYLTRLGDVSGGRNFLNIDIGGGTTDMFFVIQDLVNGMRVKKSYYTSMRFAGNDLWGDGVDGAARLSNGFYLRVKDGMTWLQAEIERQEKLVRGSGKMTSADTMAFLFRNDANEQPKIPTIIRADKKLFPLLFVHFGAILYHVAMILKEHNWEIPSTINLTGMGSKYVHIIHEQEDVVSHLAGLLLKKFTGADKLPDNFKLTYSKENAKQITAQGALKKGNNQSGLEGSPIMFKVYGVPVPNGEEQLYYEDADRDEVRQQVVDLFKQFIDDFLGDRTINTELRTNYNVDIQPALIEDLKQLATDSYYDVAGSFTEKKIGIPETLFFWPLKNSLYKLSRQ